MDCRTAQLLMDFARPQAHELADEDLRAFEDHVTACPDCGSMAASERRIDEHLGKAMRAVEVPDTLRNHLLNRLDAERNDWYKRWAGHGMRIAVAAAACLLLVIGGVWGYSQYAYWNRPEPNLDALNTFLFGENVSPPDRAMVEQRFKIPPQRIITVLPDLNYRYLTTSGMADFQGQLVPQLVFNFDVDEAGNAGARENGAVGVVLGPIAWMARPTSVHENAVVFVLSEKSFKLGGLRNTDPATSSGYRYKVDVLHQPGGSYAYIIVHTGNSLDWLLNPQ
jgi:hypothetical protein